MKDDKRKFQNIYLISYDEVRTGGNIGIWFATPIKEDGCYYNRSTISTGNFAFIHLDFNRNDLRIKEGEIFTCRIEFSEMTGDFGPFTIEHDYLIMDNNIIGSTCVDLDRVPDGFKKKLESFKDKKFWISANLIKKL